MNAWLHDIAYCLRRLARAPGFTLTSVVLLGVAMVANACVFALVHTLLYKPLPFPDAERLVNVDIHLLKEDAITHPGSKTVAELAALPKPFERLASFAWDTLWLKNGADAEPTPLDTVFVQPQLFGLLGLKPVVGRVPNMDDARAQNPGAVLVTSDFAESHYGSAQGAIDKILSLKEGDYRIIGVMPWGVPFSMYDPIWMPITFTDEDAKTHPGIGQPRPRTIAKLAPALLPSDASQQLTTLLRELPSTKDFRNLADLEMIAYPLRDLWTQVQARKSALLVMLFAVLLIMLITSVNVCNLYIARLSLRQHESAMMAALGASPGRRLRLTLIETLIIAGIGAAIGLGLSQNGFHLLEYFKLMPGETPYRIGIDAATLGFIGVLTLAVAAALTLSALWLQRKHSRVFETLKQGGTRQSASVEAQRARLTLTVVQIALTTALLIGAGLLLRSAHKLLNQDVGFDTGQLAMTSLKMDTDPETYRATLLSLRDRAANLAGVKSVTLAEYVPLNNNMAVTDYQPPGSSDMDQRTWSNANFHPSVDPSYFATLGQAVIAGRPFMLDEARSKAPLAIVDTLFVHRYFGDGEALGHTIKIRVPAEKEGDPTSRDLLIIGVVGSIRSFALDKEEDDPAIYTPGLDGTQLLIRTQINPALLERPLKDAITQVASTGKLGPFTVMTRRLENIVRFRFRLNQLLELLGGVALALASVGLYAVLAYSVRMRTSEFGIRIALGAQASRVQGDVLKQGLRLVAIGLLVGLPLAYSAAQLIASQLYHVAPFDPLTLIAVALLIAAIGLVASWWPARNAARVDPIVALRQE